MTSPVPDAAAALTAADPAATGPADAVADLRATARWTIAATAAVGALLLGGGPLVAVGRIHGWQDAAAAFGGLALAVLGIGWAIWQTGEALTPRLATLADLSAPGMAGLREAVARDPSAYYGPYGSLDELSAGRRLHEKVAAELAVRLAREQDPDRTRVLQQGLADARANAAQAGALQQRLLTLIHAWSVRNAVRRARVHTLAAFVLVTLGAVLFLTATYEDTPAQPAKSARASSSPAGLTPAAAVSR
ncbi:hypothetical protein C3489_19200 [Streptomyces sp. Ru71]|uniref:hypothetical protein n=1 Tax=Streptomyces sp. Ru71 TaxID=2080746 RepID=UPI000CDDE6FF|nr:hypothetical protein [Streptomyces sp. Ru71]POX51836.1 hypothetical protein C3489_19200 [Streptomyces sp. Ru71]